MDILDQPIQPEQFRISQFPLYFQVVGLFIGVVFLPVFLTWILMDYFKASSLAFPVIFLVAIAASIGLQYIVKANCIIRVSAQGFQLTVTKPGFQMPLSETFSEWTMMDHFQTGYDRFCGTYVTLYFADGQKIRFAKGEVSRWRQFLKTHFPEKHKAWWDWD